MMGFWKTRKAARAQLAEAVETNEIAVQQLEDAKRVDALVSGHANEHKVLIEENHVRLKLRSTFRRGEQYGH